MLYLRGWVFTIGIISALTISSTSLAILAFASTALDQMELVFVGEYSKAAIKRHLDRIMRIYNVPITEENYSRVGSVLVVMRKDTGVPEMRILRCMEGANVGAQVELPQVAALCATALSR